MSNPFLGEVRLFGFNFAPRGWAFCNGQLLSISQNTALFSLLGTMYGGNGQTNFALPDLRSRAAIHFGTGTGLSPYTQGQFAGTETITLTTQQLPAHVHTLNGDNSSATTGVPTAGNLAVPATPGRPPVAVNGYTTGAPANAVALNPASIGITGGSQPHSNIQPILVMNYCIALQGIFPSRS